MFSTISTFNSIVNKKSGPPPLPPYPYPWNSSQIQYFGFLENSGNCIESINGGYVYYSNNSGISFTQIDTATGQTCIAGNGLYIFYISTTGTSAITYDISNSTKTTYTIPKISNVTPMCMNYSGSQIYFIHPTETPYLIYYSTNYGSSFTTFNPGAIYFYICCSSVIYGSNSNITVIAGTGIDSSNIMITTNNYSTNTTTTGIYAAISPNGKYIIIIKSTTTYVYSSDGGNNYSSTLSFPAGYSSLAPVNRNYYIAYVSDTGLSTCMLVNGTSYYIFLSNDITSTAFSLFIFIGTSLGTQNRYFSMSRSNGKYILFKNQANSNSTLYNNPNL
jgi:hypothetical protein